MTGDLQPAEDGTSPVPREELRVSYEDRDRVAEALRVAAGDGRLSAEELDERLEIALTARTYAELAKVTRDLPSAAGTVLGVPSPKDVVRIDCQSSSVERTGPWLVPRRMEVRVKSGVVTLDFTEAVITQPVLRIDAEVGSGGEGPCLSATIRAHKERPSRCFPASIRAGLAADWRAIPAISPATAPVSGAQNPTSAVSSGNGGSAASVNIYA